MLNIEYFRYIHKFAIKQLIVFIFTYMGILISVVCPNYAATLRAAPTLWGAKRDRVGVAGRRQFYRKYRR